VFFFSFFFFFFFCLGLSVFFFCFFVVFFGFCFFCCVVLEFLLGVILFCGFFWFFGGVWVVGSLVLFFFPFFSGLLEQSSVYSLLSTLP